MMGYTYMGEILDIIYDDKSKWWNMMEPIYREFDILWFDMMLPQGRDNALLIWTICREKYCKLSLVVEEYRSKSTVFYDELQ